MYEREQQAALAAAREAAALCVAVRAERVEAAALEKDDRSPVTIADYGAQALVCRAVRDAFPRDPIVAEEDAAALRRPQNDAIRNVVVEHVHRIRPQATVHDVLAWIDEGNGAVADRYWTLDPIDGTKGFLRDDQYAVALALVEGGQVKLGVLACPALPAALDDAGSPRGMLYCAVRGRGASAALLSGGVFRAIHVADDGAPAAARFAESVEAGHGDQVLQQAVAAAVGIKAPPLRMDSQAKYAVVARGDAALYLRLPSPRTPDYREKIWDHAAGSLLVEEAGGRVTDMTGAPLDFAHGERMESNRGVVVSNGAHHDATIAALRSPRN